MAVHKSVTLTEATAHFSALIAEAEAGAEITITRDGRSVARIVGAPRQVSRVPGDWGWTGIFDESVLAPLTDDEMREEGWPV